MQLVEKQEDRGDDKLLEHAVIVAAGPRAADDML